MKKLISLLIALICIASLTAEDADLKTYAPNTGNVTFRTNVSDVKVYIDGRLELENTKDKTFTIEGLETGLHFVSLKKSGYYKEELFISIVANKDVIYEVKLVQITGHLLVSLDQPKATLYINDEKATPGFHELPIGEYYIKAKLFGYETFNTKVNIKQKDLTSLDIKMNKAAFDITDLTLTKKEFNPYGQGSLSTVTIKTSVTAPAEGTVEIYDYYDNLVWFYDYGTFNTWDAFVDWNGVNQKNGLIVPDGTYKVCVMAEDKMLSTTVTVNSSLFYPLVNPGSKGLQFGTLVDPEFAPSGTGYLSFDVTPTFTFDSFICCPIALNFDYAFTNHFSLGLFGACAFSNDTDFFGGANIKIGSKIGKFYYSVYGVFAAGKADVCRFNKGGIDFGLATALSFSRFFIVANIGAHYKATFEPNVALALDYQNDFISVGLWASSNIKDEYLIGVNFCQFLGKSQVFLNCDVSADILSKTIATKVGIATVF